MPDPETIGPHFVIDPDGDESIRERIVRIGNGIDDQPGAFADMLTKLGEQAFSDEYRHDQIVAAQPPAERPAARMILDYFGRRLDRWVENDPTTEAALTADATYIDLLSRQQALRNQTLSAGIQKKVMRQDPEAVAARDAVRKYRLAFYISRVIESQSATASIAQLVSSMERPRPPKSKPNGLRAAG